MPVLRRPTIALVLLSALLALSSIGTASAADLNPPIPSFATDVHCSTNPNGTICHYALSRSGSGFPNWNGVVCDGFTINYDVDAEGHVMAVYDAAGNIVKEVRYIGFTGTLINSSDPSRTVPYSGHWTRTDDFLAGTETFTGIHQHVVLPGEGLVSANIGRVVLDLDPNVLDPYFVAGQWQAFPGVGMDTDALCQALA